MSDKKDKREVIWVGGVPTNCQTCHVAITDHFYDARTVLGYWATMCGLCFCGGPGMNKLGTGYGQKYVKMEDGRWKKVEE